MCYFSRKKPSTGGSFHLKNKGKKMFFVRLLALLLQPSTASAGKYVRVVEDICKLSKTNIYNATDFSFIGFYI